MYSLNATVPGTVEALAGELRGELLAFETIRDERSMLIKRLGELTSVPRHAKQLRNTLADVGPITATVTGIDVFFDPPAGPGPVVYLAVDSPQLDAIHARLVETYGAVHQLEGSEYTMHITLARGGPESAARRLKTQSIEPITWTITELLLMRHAGTEVVDRIALTGYGVGGEPE